MLPHYALAHNALSATQAVEYLECALREANCAAPLGGFVVLIDEQDIYPVLGEIDCCAQPHWARAYHHDAVAAPLAGDQFRSFAIGE